MTKSLYATLNVAPDADPAVIEAAYKALMKKYHPDVVSADAGVSEQRAAEINEAFHVLRDPVRRADYDNQAQLGTEAIRMNASGQNVPAYPFPSPGPHPGAPRRSAGIWFLLLLLALAGAVFYVWRGSSFHDQLAFDPESSQTAAGASADAFPATSDGGLPAISTATVDRAFSEFSQIKNRSGLFGLASRSQDCFAEQSRSGRLDDFDFCVAFDNAVLTYDPGTPGSLPFVDIPRFEPKELLSRHLQAGRLVSDDEAMITDRLGRIGYMVKEKVLQARNSRSPSPAPPRLVREQHATRAEVRLPRFSKVEASPPKAAARPRTERVRKQPKPRRKAADNEFMEREGYIY